MECRTTCGARRRCAGASLVEGLVTIAIVAMITGVLAGFYLFSSRSLLVMGNHLELDGQARTALDQMTKEMRRTLGVTEFSARSITFRDFDDGVLTFSYAPDLRQLRRIKNGVSAPVLVNCDDVLFSMYQREPLSGSFDLLPTTDPAACKAVQVSWTCSRQFIESRINAATANSATIVLRSK